MTETGCEIRRATLDDWPRVRDFFRRNYRKGHPFQNSGFWRWHVGGAEAARSWIAVTSDRMVAHLGANLGSGIVWVIQLLVEPEWRRRGVVRLLYGKARELGPLATTNANAPGHRMYRKMGWYRYLDLQRFVGVRPDLRDDLAVVASVTPLRELPHPPSEHYWRQPGLHGAQFEGGTGVLQPEIGGIRLVDIHDPETLLEECWDAGFRWVDYVTSWNDPLCAMLEDEGWHMNEASPVPWLLAPVVPESVAHLSYLSEEPVPKNLIVRRTYCDHGRVGSLPPSDD